MLLTGLPGNRLSRSDRDAVAVIAADPARSADDGEELRGGGRMPSDDSAWTELDHDDVSLSGDPPHARAGTPGCGRLALAVEVDPPQSRSTTPAIACPKPMHIVATP